MTPKSEPKPGDPGYEPSRVPTSWKTNSPVPVGWMLQFGYMAKRYGEIEGVHGDIVECGLGEGNTFAMLACLIGIEDRKPPRKLWGFDSFEGWPEPTPFDASPRNPRKGEWTVSEEMVTRRLEESKISEKFPGLKIEIVKGFLDASLPNFANSIMLRRPIALLHLDVDLYQGYRDGLKHLFPMVAVGGLVLFDEYREFHPELPGYGDKEKWPGCSKAVDEYFANRPEVLQYDPVTNKYWVRKVSS